MSPESAERREYQRIRLDQPLIGHFGKTQVMIVDIGISGALVEHHSKLAMKERHKLTFPWNENEIMLLAEVARSSVGRFTGTGAKKAPVYSSGLQILAAMEESDLALREMIASYVTRALDLQKANARGLGSEPIGEETLTRLLAGLSDARGYLTCRWDGKTWKKMASLKANQPADGFTVSASEKDVDKLCRTFQSADEEGRRLIRMLAELSVAPSHQSPPVRYEP